VVGSEGNFAFRVSNKIYTWRSQTPSEPWKAGPQYGTDALKDLIGSGGNFAAEVVNKVAAWNQDTDLWTTSPLVSSGSIVEVIGSDGNFAFRVSNRFYAWSAGTSLWYTLPSTYSGFQEMIGADGNFLVRLTDGVYTYNDNDTPTPFDSTSISGVSDAVGAPLPPCSAESCSDANPCTDDVCNLALGCEFPANTNPCDDGDACTDGDVCAGEACQPGGPLDCDDADQCTADSCDEITGCINDPLPSCGIPVPAGSQRGLALLALLVATLGASLLRRRQTSRAV